MKSVIPRVLNLQARFAFDLPGGQKAFVKVVAVQGARQASKLKRRFDVEKTALRVLRGLAVPTLLPGSHGLVFLDSERRRALGLSARQMAYVSETYEGESFHGLFHQHRGGGEPCRLVGVWLFCLEQFVAFRRHQLLYTDIKCTNIVTRRKPWRVIIVDFDRVLPLIGDRTDWRRFGYTYGFEPPERLRGETPSEASCVYQAALLLLHFLTGGDSRSVRDSERGLPAVAATLAGIELAWLTKLLGRCINDDPAQRLPHYEALLEAARSNLPERTVRTWLLLRSPYAARLAEVGLHAPTRAGRSMP